MTAEHEEKPIRRHHKRRLPFVASPIADHDHHSHFLEDNLHTQNKQPREHESEEGISPQHTKNGFLSKITTHGQSDRPDSHPAFQRHAEATPSELFYDLFFVANLTAFTGKHEINDMKSLTSYIGFFGVLWFTWFQVSLYDLRFSKDTILDRICKGLQFGFMVGFMVVSVNFDPQEGQVDIKTLSLLLMGSRLVLFLQYTIAGIYLIKWPTVRLPMLVTAAITFVCAMVYLGIAFSTTLVSPWSFIAWYVLALAEAVLTIASSCYWRALSYKGTHIVERMSLLTLIILGEGVIGIGEAIQNSVGSNPVVDFEAPVVGVILSATVLLYFLYMLYFDNLPEEHFGTIRQQFWAIVHFPLHLGLVLFVEASASFIKFQRASDVSQNLVDILIPDETGLAYTLFETNGPLPSALNTTEAFEELTNTLNATALDYLSNYGKGIDANTTNSVREGLETIADGTQQSFDAVANAFTDVVFELLSAVYGTFGIEIPENQQEAADEQGEQGGTGAAELYALNDLFNLVYIYFFVAGGIALMIMGVMAFMSQSGKKRVWDYIRCGLFELVGLLIGLLALLDTSYVSSVENYVGGPWVVPSVMLMVGVIVVANQF